MYDVNRPRNKTIYKRHLQYFVIVDWILREDTSFYEVEFRGPVTEWGVWEGEFGTSRC